jgi:hypothetical protein
MRDEHNGQMGKRRPLELSALDDKLLDGLKFCLKVYDLFDQIRAEPGGMGKIRMLESKREKRLQEELLPIARYIQARYDVGNRMKVRWLSGSQPYDAIVWTPLEMARRTNIPRKIIVEVTTSQHENTHLARKQVHETGGSFGPKGIRINRKTGVPDSAPYVYSGTEHISDLASQLIDRIGEKALKSYPPSTALIVNCVPDRLIFEEEWVAAMNEVRNSGIHNAFREVFITSLHHSTSLWRSPK